MDMGEIKSGKGPALKALVSFFTAYHLDINEKDMDAMERNFHLVPIVGSLFAFLLIAILTVMYCLFRYGNAGGGMLSAAVALATVYIGSKFIHFDGLTDFGDGMIASGDREKHIRALKDTLVGAGGIGVALITVLLSFSVYSSAGALIIIAIAPLTEVMVKNAMVFAAAFGLAGNGMAGRQVERTTTVTAGKSMLVAIVCGLIVAAVASVVVAGFGGFAYMGIFGPALFAMFIGLIVSCAMGVLMARNANKVFGMVNGDILGATNEVSRPAVAFAMLIVMGFLVI